MGIAFVLLLAHGILRTQLFDIDRMTAREALDVERQVGADERVAHAESARRDGPVLRP